MFHRPKATNEDVKSAEAAEENGEAETQETASQENKPQAEETQGQSSSPIDALKDNNRKDTSSMSQSSGSSSNTSSIDIPNTNASPFQRPGSAPASPSQSSSQRGSGNFGGYTPSYGSSGNNASSSSTKNVMSSANGRRLVIGEGITLSGEIESCDHLLVEGTVEAGLKNAKVLEISSSGIFYGTVEIEEAEIAGRFEGDLNVSKRLTIRSGGSITGSIRYGELAIEAGATIEGKLLPLNAPNTMDNHSSSGTKARESLSATN